jgi:hypothetical protein
MLIQKRFLKRRRGKKRRVFEPAPMLIRTLKRALEKPPPTGHRRGHGQRANPTLLRAAAASHLSRNAPASFEFVSHALVQPPA